MTDVKKVRTTLLKASSAFLSFLLLCACDSTLFHSFKQLNGGWERGVVLEYKYAGSTVNRGGCGMFVETRTTAGYRYKNVVVRAECLDMRDSILSVDTVPIVVYKDNGRRAGATAGMLYQQESELAVMNLPACDSLVIRLSHIMPDDTLTGITDVGVRLVRLR